MARVTVEDCLELVGNQFRLVLIASHRARMILYGDKPLLKAEGEKPSVVALREISAGLIDETVLNKPVVSPKLDGEYPRFLTDPEPNSDFSRDGSASEATMAAPPPGKKPTESDEPAPVDLKIPGD